MCKLNFKHFVFCALGATVAPILLINSEDYSTSPYIRYKSEISESRVNLVNSTNKYILQWASPYTYKGFTENASVRKQCKYKNCVVTSNRTFLSDLTRFDLIIFYAADVMKFKRRYDLPKTRSTHQKFVIASRESSHYYKICSNRFDGYFNWSWTYRLDSDISWSFMIVKDKKNTIIGPNKEMHWMKLADMDPVSEELKAQLRMKTKAAVWFVSNCRDRSGRKRFADMLKRGLARFNLTLDVYGNCGTKKCGSRCLREIRCDILIKDYYFYLSFENSFCEDYVTEKLTRALQFDAVPIVYGFANYTRFMPDGIYLNAKDFGPKALAAKMNELIHTPDEYANFFKWRNHYSYHSRNEEGSPENSDYCTICAILNDEKKMKKPSVINNFYAWWNNPNHCLDIRSTNNCGYKSGYSYRFIHLPTEQTRVASLNKSHSIKWWLI